MMRCGARWVIAMAVVFVLAGATVQAGDFFHGLFVNGKIIHGSGDMVTETRDVATFSRISMTMGVDVIVTVGSAQQVKLTFDDNIIGKIKTRVRGHELEIYSRGSFAADEKCRIEISVPTLDGFSLAGSGNIEIHGLNGDEFEIELAGSGDITIDGTTKSLNVDLAGSGDIDTRKLIAEDAEVDLAGSGNVLVYAAKSLDADISGSGDIRYYGDPEYVDSDVSGSGSIRRGRG